MSLVLKFLFQQLLWLYQRLISPFLSKRCRFYPTCSHYAQDCLRQKSLGKALSLTTKRLLKCHPWHPGGYDPVLAND